ncbi:hypothetical protein EDD21DRAFT_446634 [Dissophora ornata]|nr:hypothetical protein EDD21DRAFT_446634 [Dissophora ornata]
MEARLEELMALKTPRKKTAFKGLCLYYTYTSGALVILLCGTELIQGISIPLLGSFHPPLSSLETVLRNTPASVIQFT